jgi:hypothetical protein
MPSEVTPAGYEVARRNCLAGRDIPCIRLLHRSAATRVGPPFDWTEACRIIILELFFYRGGFASRLSVTQMSDTVMGGSSGGFRSIGFGRRRQGGFSKGGMEREEMKRKESGGLALVTGPVKRNTYRYS